MKVNQTFAIPYYYIAFSKSISHNEELTREKMHLTDTYTHAHLYRKQM